MPFIEVMDAETTVSLKESEEKIADLQNRLNCKINAGNGSARTHIRRGRHKMSIEKVKKKAQEKVQEAMDELAKIKAQLDWYVFQFTINFLLKC